MTLALLALLLSQTPVASQIVDGTIATRKATVTSSNALKVECTNCSGGSGASVVFVDGGVIVANQGAAGATPWPVTATQSINGSSTANNTGTCVSVTTSSTAVLAANASRKKFTIVALTTNSRVRFKLGTTATTSNMPLEAGQAFTEEGQYVYTGAVDAISESGTNTICVVEL